MSIFMRRFIFVSELAWYRASGIISCNRTNDMQKTLLALALAGSLAGPALASAATYQYIAFDGSVEDVVASDATTAIAVAPNRTPTSGVILVDGTPAPLPENMMVAVSTAPLAGSNIAFSGAASVPGTPNTGSEDRSDSSRSSSRSSDSSDEESDVEHTTIQNGNGATYVIDDSSKGSVDHYTAVTVY